jgi:hypothetical protein
MRYSIHRLAILALTSILVRGVEIKSTVRSAQPLWSFDLSASGYQGGETTRDSVFSISSLNEGIAFTDNGTVVAYFVTKAEAPELSNRKDAKVASPFHLRAVFGDISGRKITSTNDWPTRAFPSWLMPTADGKLIIRTGESLQLYSSQFSLIKERSLEASGRRFESWHVKGSPSGKVLWLDHEEGGSNVEVLDSSSLQRLSAWEQEALGSWFSVSDHAIAKSPVNGRQQVIVKNLGGQWRVLYDAGPGGCSSEPNFVSDNMLITGPCGSVGLISTSGEVLMKDKIPKGEHIEGDVAPSRNGKMAAVSLMRTKGGAFDTSIRRSSTTVLVYDLERRSVVLRVEVNPLPKSSYHFALSPDGAFLAVMTDSTVKIYATKSAPAEHSTQKVQRENNSDSAGPNWLAFVNRVQLLSNNRSQVLTASTNCWAPVSVSHKSLVLAQSCPLLLAVCLFLSARFSGSARRTRFRGGRSASCC